MDRKEPSHREIDVHSTMAVPEPSGERLATFPYHPGETILPGYRLEKRLGSGGFGEVWRATAPGGMGVAIKILANLGRAQGGREYRALQTIKNIRHAHIVPIFGVWLKSGNGRVLGDAELVEAERRLLASRGTDWQAGQAVAETVDADRATGSSDALESLELIIAMGLGDQTLQDRLRQGEGGIPVESLVDWMHQAALALDHFNSGARRSGENLTAVQHCDIKPANMLLVGDAVQVCDFGLARAQGEVRATSNTMASIAYAAPEMVSGRCEPAPSTDQYSLALSYVELRTGRLPYPELTAAAILKAKLDGTIDLSGLPEAEARVIAKALAVDPAKRWRTCAEFVREIRNSEKTEGSPRQHGRRPALAAAIIAAVAIAGAAGYATLRGFSSTPTREAAQSLEKVSRFADAGAMYASLYAAQPDTLASVLWDLQTRASDARRTGESVSLLRRLERLYAASPPPKVKGIGRWDVVNSLAWYLATDPSLGPAAAEESNRLAEEALRLAERDGTMIPQSLDTAAAAAARIGRFDEAVERIEKAIELADDAGARAEFERRRDAYRERRAWTEPQ
jgi:serine/threonine protein kinase